MTGAPIARLAPFQQRSLTAGERAIAYFMFADEAPFAHTRIVQAPPLRFAAMAPTRHAIVFSTWRAPWDFADAPLAERGWFVHELTHIWQSVCGRFLPLAKLSALGARAYTYSYSPHTPFSAYNIEQQCEIARHLYLARCGAPAPDAPGRAALEALWPIA